MTFAVYVLSSPENVLTAEKTFVALALFSILRFPISVFPMLVGTLVQVSQYYCCQIIDSVLPTSLLTLSLVLPFCGLVGGSVSQEAAGVSCSIGSQP